MTTSDQEAIVATALDYFEGWFDGDVARMRRALHPALAKRAQKPDSSFNETTAEEMIDATTRGVGKTRDVPDRAIQVEVVDVHGDIASAIVRSAVYHEYIHLVRTSDGWRIANTLYERS